MRSLIVKIISEKNIGYGALLSTLKAVWKCRVEFKIIGLGPNLYQVQFDFELDADKVLIGCPWYHDSQLLIIKKWKPGVDVEEGVFDIAPIWVQIWNLRLEWISEDAGEHICKNLGKVVKKQVVFGKYGKFVRCLVEMDISKPLVQEMLVGQGNEERWVSFTYEHGSLFCAYCGVIGHSAAICYAKVID